VTQKIVLLSTEQIGLLKNLINNEAQRIVSAETQRRKGLRTGTKYNPDRMVFLGEIITSLEQARDLP
jgi:hypothetical protein